MSGIAPLVPLVALVCSVVVLGSAQARHAPDPVPISTIPQEVRSVTDLVREAGEAAARDDLERARQLLESARNQAPTSGPVHYNLAIVHERLGNSARALAEYERARRDPELAVAASENLAMLLFRSGDHLGAIHVLRTALANHPSSGSLRYHLAALSLVADGDSQAEARTLLLEALDRGFRPPHAFLLLGRIARGAGDLAAARAYLERGLAGDPEDPTILHELALTLEALGELDHAARLLRAAIRLTGSPRAALSADLGRVLLRTGEVDAAVRLLDDALAAHPRSPELLYQLAGARRRAGMPGADEILRRFQVADAERQAADEARRKANVAEATAMRALEAGDLIAAEAALREAVKTWSGNLDARARLAAVLLELGSRDEAKELVGELLAAAPTHPEGLVVLAEIRSARSPGEGLEILERAVTLHPYRIVVLVSLAKAYMEVGRASAAEALARRAAAVKPDAPGVESLLGRFEREGPS